MQRAAIYARFSTDLQRDRSIDDQVALCRRYAESQGLTVSKVYSDRARTSASLFGREGLLSLMEDARARRFEVVVVEGLDRISRDQEDLAGIHKRLSFAGVDILAVHDGRADVIQIGIRGLMGQLFLADLKHKVRRGMEGVVRDGRHAGGRAYGYRPKPGEPGELEIVPEEAAVVRRIFDDYLAGVSPREIAGNLNAEGIVPPRGSKWSANTINGNATRGHGILLNPIYAGRIVWNRVTMVRDPDTGRRVSRPNPPEEWRWADAPHLAIIPADRWEAAQTRKAAQSKAHESRQDRRPKRPLSGLLRCGCCGGGMSIHDRKAGAVRVRCTTAKESGSCSNVARYRVDRIEAAVFEHLAGMLSDPVYLREYLRAYHEERTRTQRAAAKDRAKLERAAAQTRGAYDRAVRLYIDGITDGPEAQADILRAKEAMRAAQAALEAADPAEVLTLHPGAVERYGAALERLSARLADIEPRHDAEVLEALREIVAEVRITPGEGTAVVEVFGRLAALTGGQVDPVGGLVVAEEGLEPPTRGL